MYILLLFSINVIEFRYFLILGLIHLLRTISCSLSPFGLFFTSFCACPLNILFEFSNIFLQVWVVISLFSFYFVDTLSAMNKLIVSNLSSYYGSQPFLHPSPWKNVSITDVSNLSKCRGTLDRKGQVETCSCNININGLTSRPPLEPRVRILSFIHLTPSI